MKRILLLSFLLAGLTAFGQIKTPASSSSCKTTQVIGLTDFTVEYSRPSVKGRSIFANDGLVKLGQLWRLGANRVTKMSFSTDVALNGSALEAGDYAVLATPTASEWTFHFYTYDSGSWSSYKELDPVLSVSSPTYPMGEKVETFMITPDEHTDSGANIYFLWDKTMVALGVTTEVDGTVMKNIETVMNGPSANDMYQAATYYHKNGKDLKQALTWITKATAGDSPRFWQVRRKALILADLGKTKDAISAAKLSQELAQEAGNMEYVEMNKKSIMEWSK